MVQGVWLRAGLGVGRIGARVGCGTGWVYEMGRDWGRGTGGWAGIGVGVRVGGQGLGCVRVFWGHG